MSKANMVGWFEIPVTDMKRAKKFYEKVFDIEIKVQQFGDEVMGWFPFPEDQEERGAGGSLVQLKDFYQPSSKGVLIYFSCKELSVELNRVEQAGGEILKKKSLIAEDIGYMGLFTDCEGNRIALHSRQ